ncbi:MAG: 23S rRNA (adenine(2503)-C(2))-methyltransferase RlmN [Ruminococcaceae bacterium]|nr:23S rRNA (adenine(2503)-C(2))-methyltransferase RlmN [Oscillospiraceae bacterium]
MIDLKSMDLTELTDFFTQQGHPKFRAEQVFVWMQRGVTSFDEMSNLSKGFREELKKTASLTYAECYRKQVSKRDGTVKFLWRFPDGNAVESVFMEYKHGNTVCISTQVGCRMGCRFCASTIGGKIRDLTAGEMLEQVLRAQIHTGKKVSNIVLMGTGEPFDNYDNVRKFLQLVNHPKGMGIGMRHISISTCGLCDGIRRLADENLQVTLSISLHAPDNETRDQLMPVNQKYPVEELIRTCKAYYEKTSRRISFEYTMIRGVSDTQDAAKKLAGLLKGFPCHVNLIPLHRVDGRHLEPSTPQDIARFMKILEQSGLTVTVRRSLGEDIDAACGQLKSKTEQALTERGDIS